MKKKIIPLGFMRISGYILPFWFITISECFPNIRISECWWWKEKENVIWNSGRKSYLHFFFCSQHSTNLTKFYSKFNIKKCDIFITYYIFFSGFAASSINIIGSDSQVFEGRLRRWQKNGNDTTEMAYFFNQFGTTGISDGSDIPGMNQPK